MWTTDFSVADSNTALRSAASLIDCPRISMKSVFISEAMQRASWLLPSPQGPTRSPEGNFAPSWYAASRATRTWATTDFCPTRSANETGATSLMSVLFMVEFLVGKLHRDQGP